MKNIEIGKVWNNMGHAKPTEVFWAKIYIFSIPVILTSTEAFAFIMLHCRAPNDWDL